MFTLPPRYSIIILLLLLSFGYTTNAQQKASYTVKYQDSLLAAKEALILYNIVEITNNASVKQTVKGYITPPKGWKNLFGNQQKLSLEMSPGETKKIPVNIAKGKNSPAQWQPVIIKLWNANSADTQQYSFNIAAEAVSGLKVENVTEMTSFEERPDDLPLGVYLKNTGNVTDQFRLYYKSLFFELDKMVYITLAPEQDTTYYFQFHLTGAKWKALYKEQIDLYIDNGEDKREEEKVYEKTKYYVSKPRNSVKENRSAYKSVPLTLEGGVSGFGKILNYTFGVRGGFSAKDHQVDVMYRSRPLGPVQGMFTQTAMYNVSYKYKNWDLTAAPMGSAGIFTSVGNGLSLSYTADKLGVGIRGYRHSERMYSKNDGLVGYTSYRLGKLQVSHQAEGNFNTETGNNAYVVSNKVEIVNKKDINVSVSLGGGTEEHRNAAYKMPTQTSGASAGYDARATKGEFSIASNAQYFGKDHPGMRKGLSTMYHTISWKPGQFQVGLLYSGSYIRSLSRMVIDSNYMESLFRFNGTVYGMHAGMFTNKFGTSMGFGVNRLKSDIGNNFMDGYYYLSLGASYQLSKYLSVTATTTNDFRRKNDPITTRATFSLRSRYYGFTAMYNKTPNFRTDGTGQKFTNYYQTYGGTFNLNYSFLRNKLYSNIAYSVLKTEGSNMATDNNIYSTVSGNVSYNNTHTGTSVQFSANMPINSNQQQNSFAAMPFGSLNVSQTLNIPVITKRKYYDLKLVLYNDENNNNQKDENESAIRYVQVDINEESLITNDDGMIEYRNIEDGSYRLGLLNTNADGLIPSEGAIQSLVVDANTVVEIPFKKGKMIFGTVKINQDSLANTQLTPDYVKVTAVDTSDRKYMTVTDAFGNFAFTLPAGVYSLELNQMAFAGSDFKPVKTAYNIDLMKNDESIVTFEVEQKKRKVRFLQADAGVARKDD